MTVGNHKRNTIGLEQFREAKKLKCRKHVEEVINEMIHNHATINFNTVGEKAGVSKKYLYDNYFNRIDDLRKKQEEIRPKHIKQQMSNSSKDVLLAAKNKRIKELEAEVSRLKKIIQHKFSEEYNNI